MRVLGEQWVEEVDGVRHMVKAVKGVEGEKLCTACIFKPRIYPDYSKIRHDTVQTPFRCAYGVLCPIEEGYIIDLGPVNDNGCLESPIGKGFPTIRQNSDKTWVVFWTDSKNVRIFSVGATEQEAIDAWNRRN